ncbi:MAG: hypothetical protein ACU0CI_13730, partial [Shimia sp.]
LNNRSATTRLLGLRDRAGVLTPEDFTRVGVLIPPGAGLTSSVFDATVLAEVDGVAVRLESRILRDAQGEVGVIRRRYGQPLPPGLAVGR